MSFFYFFYKLHFDPKLDASHPLSRSSETSSAKGMWVAQLLIGNAGCETIGKELEFKPLQGIASNAYEAVQQLCRAFDLVAPDDLRAIRKEADDPSPERLVRAATEGDRKNFERGKKEHWREEKAKNAYLRFMQVTKKDACMDGTWSKLTDIERMGWFQVVDSIHNINNEEQTT